ncbi:MAG: UDP-N-acetylmuramoyl-L-alanyl-D-glutamate--2,6-diaminopimelate ligase [Nonlabens sp.]
MKNLKDLLYKSGIQSVVGSTDRMVNEVRFDSREVGKQDVFVAVRGDQSDGHDFIPAAINNGAMAIVVEVLPSDLKDGITYVHVVDAHIALAQMAANFYDHPSRSLKLVGVTGTNGKTTVTSLLYQLFRSCGFKSGLISTVEILIDSKKIPATHTTPDPLTINHTLSQMQAVGVDYCFMEVSSHGIAQQRVHGLHFSGGIFTNLSHDHLDYHNSFKEYRNVKKQFFDGLPRNAFAITNKDDKNGSYMLQNTRARSLGYALKTATDYHGRILENQFGGLLLKINEQEVWTRMIGKFNAYNITAIYGCAVELGLEPIEVLQAISKLETVSGRFQYFTTVQEKITAIVDYAHTPDALKNVLETINAIRTRNEQLITVVGCGGDRDRTKRPKMARIAAMLSDKVVLTSDNPRNENPRSILEEMEAGVEPVDFKKVLTVVDRKQGIKTATMLAGENDIILIAGKGHENYQIIKGEKLHFDDREVVIEYLKKLNK